MRIWQGTKKFFRPFVNVTAWIDSKQLTEMTKGIVSTVKTVFTSQEAERSETFEQALKRYNLSPEDLESRKKGFMYYAIFWLVLAFCILAYGVYLAGAGSWHGFLATIAISSIAFAQAFRNHFWYFQIKERKLGCSWRDWLNGSVSGKSDES